MTKFCGISDMISVDLHSWCGEWGTNRVEDGDEREGQADGKLAQKEAISLGEMGNETHGKLCLRKSRSHFFCLQWKWGKRERESTGRWLVFGAMSLALDLNL